MNTEEKTELVILALNVCLLAAHLFKLGYTVRDNELKQPVVRP